MSMDLGYTFRGSPSLRMRVNKAMDQLDALDRGFCSIRKVMDEFAHLPRCDASPYWMRRNDPSGKPDQLELTHPVDSAYYREKGRRREYIGVDPEKIRAALDSIERHERWLKLEQKLEQIEKQMQRIERQINQLEYVALGERQSILGHKIQAHS